VVFESQSNLLGALSSVVGITSTNDQGLLSFVVSLRKSAARSDLFLLTRFLVPLPVTQSGMALEYRILPTMEASLRRALSLPQVRLLTQLSRLS